METDTNNTTFENNIPEDQVFILNETLDYIKTLSKNDLIEYVRKIRNTLLYDTDWTTLSDSPLSEDLKQQYIVYRQALRDLPQTINTYQDLVWPIRPE
jgi:hypothetical protein